MSTAYLVVGAIVVVLISESLYVIRNELWRVDRLKLAVSAKLVKNNCRRGKYKVAAANFEKVVRLRISQMQRLNDMDSLNEWNVGNEGDFFCEMTEQLSEIAMVEGSEAMLAPFVYELGLRAYGEDVSLWIEPLWQRAMYLAPDWSYYYVELANYYMIDGGEDLALYTLSKCQENESSRFHCEEFERYLEGMGEVGEVGFLRKEIWRAMVGLH